jgi:hypothetical protein
MTLHVKYKIMAYSLEYCFSSLQPMYNFGHRQWDLDIYKIELYFGTIIFFRMSQDVGKLRCQIAQIPLYVYFLNNQE